MRPFMFRAPLLMQQGASLTRALSLFRQMGLHHILIAPPDPRAVGFVTRKVGQRPHLLMRSACMAGSPDSCHAMAVSLLIVILVIMLCMQSHAAGTAVAVALQMRCGSSASCKTCNPCNVPVSCRIWPWRMPSWRVCARGGALQSMERI